MTALTGADYRGALDVLRIAHESDDSVPFSRNMLGINHVMKLFFAVGETGASYLVLDSERRAFSDRDRAVLDLLAPHLALIRQRHRRLADASFETPAAAALLGAREREILDLVASGMTNREIAAALFIPPGTVRKHLDNVYAKLGVRSRAQAVAVTVDRGQSALIAESQALQSLHD